jgi:hypothetical protein
MRRSFISATSQDLGSYRRVARVLLSKDVFPMLQDHSRPPIVP